MMMGSITLTPFLTILGSVIRLPHIQFQYLLPIPLLPRFLLLLYGYARPLRSYHVTRWHHVTLVT
jgi:hypothetical protein